MRAIGARFVAVVACLCVMGASGPPSAVAVTKRVVLLKTMPVPVVEEQSRLFIEEMARLGYVAGVNLDLTVLQADGAADRSRALLQQALAAGRPDLVVTSATLAAQETKKLLRKTGIPHLFFTVSDPVGAGLVRAEGVATNANITGVIHGVDREVKLAMVMGILGRGAKKKAIGVVHSSYPSAVSDVSRLHALAEKRSDVRFVTRQVPYESMPEGKERMFREAARLIKALDREVDCWWQATGPLGELPEFVRVVHENSAKPVVFGINYLSVKAGALFHLTPSGAGTARAAAASAWRILRGEDAGGIPVIPPAEIEAGVNLTTALRHNLTLPSALLELAGDNIVR